MLKNTAVRFGREDWIALGLAALARSGPEALTLERVTAAAGKTRGSFYHHFADHEAFLAALGARWRETSTETPIATTERQRGRRSDTLARRTAAIDHALERNLRRLAASEPAIAREVKRVDEARIRYLVKLFRDELGVSPAEALARARIQHAYFVGAQMVFPEADARFRLRLQKTLGATLWRA
ncbi:MAG TPA: helix-turn-helix domain-containing protein [Terricaulis sp.]|nr:helix-turn-helix domain-containing protein [Terricaulis sp.]